MNANLKAIVQSITMLHSYFEYCVLAQWVFPCKYTRFLLWLCMVT